MWMDILILTAGLAVLTYGADWLVKGAASFALQAGLTPLMVGLTIVAFGTSAPELTVSIQSVTAGYGDMAVGNVIGSNIFNVGFILGLSALIWPVSIKLSLLKIDAPLMVAASVGGAFIVASGSISRTAGMLLLVLLAAYTYFSYRASKRQAREDAAAEFAEAVPAIRPLGMNLLLIGAGLGLLILGSRMLVQASVSIGRALDISDAVMGLTVVAAGTSMPELATSCVAAFRRQSDIAIGNVIGSNLFNLLGILGLSSAVHPIHIQQIQHVDLWFMCGFAFLVIPLMYTSRKLQRSEGLLLLAGYALYLGLRWP